MLIGKSADIHSSDVTPRTLYVRRRDLLRLFGATVTALVAGSRGSASAATIRGRPLTIISKMVTTSDTLTPFDAVTSFNNFYEFGEDKGDPAANSGAFKPSPWSV